MIERQKSYLSQIRLIPGTVWALGLVTLLMNSSTIIVFSLMPLYLTSVMGISMRALGSYEGLIEGTSWVMRIFSGPLSDYLAKRKPLLLVASLFSVLSRVLLPYAPNIATVVSARIVDRIGNGLQASPREALIGEISPQEIKGSCYGLRQTLGLIGSCLGAVLVIYIMDSTQNNYLTAFQAAIIPAVIATLLIIAFVRDARTNIKKIRHSLRHIFGIKQIKQLSHDYGRVVAFAALFKLSYYSGTWSILQAQAAGLGPDKISLVMVVQNFMGFIMAFPAGILSDKFGRRRFLLIGCILNIAGNLLLAQTSSLLLVMVGIGVWGAQVGMMDGLISTKISENSPKELRATAFAVFFGVNALMVTISNYIAGSVAHSLGLEYFFYVAAFFGIIATLSMGILPSSNKEG